MRLIPHSSLLKTDGVAILITVLMVGGIIIEIGVAFLFINYFLGQSGFGARTSAEALGAAQAGIYDGVIKIVRDKNYPSATSYDLNVGDRSAQVTICSGFKTVTAACDTAMSGKSEITSLGMAVAKRRELRAILSVGSATGEVRIESIQEIAL